MPNISPEDISDAIVGILENVDAQTVVIDDKRLAKTNMELARLLKSQDGEEDWRGWIVTFASIPQQVFDGDCIVVTTYQFFAKFYYRYTDDLPGDVSSDLLFKRAIFAANEALNMSLDLGLGNLITHLCLQQQGEFDLEEIGGGTVNQLCHTATFTLDIESTNSY